MLTVDDIARICHEANRAIQQANNDFESGSWDVASDEEQDASILGVENHLGNPRTLREAHQCWLNYKVRKGWRYGLKKSRDEKTHPCILPYDELPVAEKVKDYVFMAIVDACKHINAGGE